MSMECDSMHGQHIPPVILASASPRRSELLAEAGYKFTVIKPDVDETDFCPDKIEPFEFAERLALAKAKSVAQKYHDGLIIAADTIVDFAGQIIGKPTDAKEARQIIQKLFSAPHKVITGIAVVRLCDNTEIVAHDSTTVHPKQLTPEQIEEHIKKDQWKDKSGAYAIKETGDEFIERIDGSITNVMGLPTELLGSLLGKVPYRK